MVSNKATPTDYEFEPFEAIFIARREEILRLVDLSSHATRSLEGSAQLSKALRHEADHVARIEEIEQRALAEAKADFPLLHGAATVLMWGALEAALRDFLVRWLTKYPNARKVPDLNSVRVKVAEYESLDGEDRMRYLVGVLERDMAASLKPGAGRFDCLLKPFGIDPKIEDKERRDLNEMAAFRNVLVHRAGIADRRFAELCPWCGVKEGTLVRVGREAFLRFVRASSHYAAAVVTAAHSTLPNGKASDAV
jgi:hypothetical protein